MADSGLSTRIPTDTVPERLKSLLSAALSCQVGDLIEYVPDAGRKNRRSSRQS